MTRILIIKMWALGDILMATPMLNAIRAKEPDAHITWIVDSYHAEVLASHPQIDEIIPLDSGKWRRLLRKVKIPAWIKRTRELNREMRDRSFDIVINCQPEKWWTCFLCPAPARVALFPSPDIPTSGRLYTHSIPKPKRVGLHNTDHFLQATAAVGFEPAGKKMSIGETADEAPFYAEFTARHGLSPDRLTVVIAPFSTAANRTFDPDFTAAVADWLATTLDAQIVITGGPSDGPKAGAILALTTKASAIFAGATTLRQYIALLRHADLVITGDSSPMHISAALDTPYITLFGPTPVDERAPLDGRGIVLSKPIPCAPCDLPTCANPVFKECLRRIELTDVQRAMSQILQTYGWKRRGTPAGKGGGN